MVEKRELNCNFCNPPTLNKSICRRNYIVYSSIPRLVRNYNEVFRMMNLEDLSLNSVKLALK